jgi:hypothetical protein
VDWWSVSVEAQADGNGGVLESAQRRFADLTRPYDGSIAADAELPRWTARVSVEAAGAAEAVAEAVRLVTSLAADAGLPGWPVVRAEAARRDIVGDDISDDQQTSL